MPKILYGPAIADARGSIGTCVFSTGRAGSVIRQRVLSTQPNTPEQQAVRAGLASLSKRWDNVLDESQRSDWRTLAMAHPRQDLFLKTYYLTGLQMYIAANQALHKIGRAYIDDAPLSFSAGNVSTVTLAWDHIAQTLTVDASPEPSTDDVPVIWASAQVKPGKTVATGHLMQLDYFDANLAGPWDITAVYQVKHGTFILFRAIFIRVRYTDQTSGAQGLPADNYVYLSA
jgi:hypothetical protein